MDFLKGSSEVVYGQGSIGAGFWHVITCTPIPGRKCAVAQYFTTVSNSKAVIEVPSSLM